MYRGDDAHRLDEAADVGDAAVELAGEVVDLVGAPEAQMIGGEDVKVLPECGELEFPGEFGCAAYSAECNRTIDGRLPAYARPASR